MSAVSPNEDPICPAWLPAGLGVGVLVVMATLPLPVVVVLGTGIGSCGELMVLRCTEADAMPVGVIESARDVLVVDEREV